MAQFGPGIPTNRPTTPKRLKAPMSTMLNLRAIQPSTSNQGLQVIHTSEPLVVCAYVSTDYHTLTITYTGNFRWVVHPPENQEK